MTKWITFKDVTAIIQVLLETVLWVTHCELRNQITFLLN